MWETHQTSCHRQPAQLAPSSVPCQQVPSLGEAHGEPQEQERGGQEAGQRHRQAEGAWAREEEEQQPWDETTAGCLVLKGPARPQGGTRQCDG